MPNKIKLPPVRSTQRVNVALTPDTYKKLSKLAAENSVSRTVIMTHIVNHAYENLEFEHDE
jgi:predicted transcriptional regulator